MRGAAAMKESITLNIDTSAVRGLCSRIDQRLCQGNFSFGGKPTETLCPRGIDRLYAIVDMNVICVNAGFGGEYYLSMVRLAPCDALKRPRVNWPDNYAKDHDDSLNGGIK